MILLESVIVPLNEEAYSCQYEKSKYEDLWLISRNFNFWDDHYTIC